MMSEEKIHVYVTREVLFKRSLTVSIKVIVSDDTHPDALGDILEKTIEAVQKWEPRKEWE